MKYRWAAFVGLSLVLPDGTPQTQAVNVGRGVTPPM